VVTGGAVVVVVGEVTGGAEVVVVGEGIGVRRAAQVVGIATPKINIMERAKRRRAFIAPACPIITQNF
jgi:hypothetical protein